MADIIESTLTNAGRNLIVKALEGKQLKFTKGVVGSAYLPDGTEIATLSNVISPMRNMDIGYISVPGEIGVAKITLEMSNKDLLTGFFIREVGVFALDPDTNEEVLYSYANFADTAHFLPGQDSEIPIWYRIQIKTVIDQAKDVTAILTDNPLAVSYVELGEATDEIYKHFQNKIAALQSQINGLANVVMHLTFDTKKEVNNS
mgnify:CR=1 FL=1